MDPHEVKFKLPKIAKIAHIFRKRTPSFQKEQFLLEDYLQKYVSEHPTGESLYKLALVRLLQGDMDTGIVLLNKSLEKESTSTIRNLALDTKRKLLEAKHQVKKAERNSANGEYDLAVGRYKDALIIFKDFPTIQCKLREEIIRTIQKMDVPVEDMNKQVFPYCTRILEFDRHNIPMLKLRAAIFQNQDRVNEYLDDLEHLRILFRNNPEEKMKVVKKMNIAKQVIFRCGRNRYYDLIGISKNATRVELEKVFERELRRVNPAKIKELSGIPYLDFEWIKKHAEVKYEALIAAKEVLLNDERRHAYDLEIDRMTSPTLASSPPMSPGRGGGVCDGADPFHLHIRTRRRSGSKLNLARKKESAFETVVKRLELRLLHSQRENYLLKSKLENLSVKLQNKDLEYQKNVKQLSRERREVSELKKRVFELEECLKVKELEVGIAKLDKMTDVNGSKNGLKDEEEPVKKEGEGGEEEPEPLICNINKINEVHVLETMRRRYNGRLRVMTDRIHDITDQIHQRISDLRKSSRLCVICCDRIREVALIPCGHVTCKHCSIQLDECPFCRKEIEKRIELFGI